MLESTQVGCFRLAQINDGRTREHPSSAAISKIIVLVELLDLTFASRTSGLVGSECQIRSTSPGQPEIPSPLGKAYQARNAASRIAEGSVIYSTDEGHECTYIDRREAPSS